MIEQHIAVYREEATELLAELETALLDLEARPDDKGLINQIFRAMHTIKGSGAMVGLDDIAAFTHEVETVFDLVRTGKMSVTKELLNLTLRSRDHIASLLLASVEHSEADKEEGTAIITGFRSLVLDTATIDTGAQIFPSTSPSSKPAATGGDLQTWRIRFQPNRELLIYGSNPIALINELRGLGTCLVKAYPQDIPPLDQLVAEHLYLYWDIILTTNRGEEAIRDVFIFIEDDCRIKIELIDDANQSPGDDSYKKLGEILVERGDVTADVLQDVLQKQRPLGELLVDAGAVGPEKVDSALAEQHIVKQLRQERTAPEPVASIRVPADKLDRLVNLVGEMVTVQARLTQIAKTYRRNKLGNTQTEPTLSRATLLSIAEEVERLTNDLRDTALNIRMLPIGSTFSKFKRLVRDLSQELGKEIELETFGADTELDKTVIEKLNDPLVHIIRNCVDHGIEKPADRLARGKPALGTIRLGAEHAGDSVLITIADDGGGINRDTIRKKAVELGMIAAGADLSDQEILGHIFTPGFSLAAKVTSVSGRGVGMDVVKRNIEGLRGTILVDSILQKGTTITLKIPLTLAIIESLLVRAGENHFVLPLVAVEECVELSRADVAANHGRNLAKVREELIPYVILRDQFAIAGQRPDIEQIVIAKVRHAKVGFVVDCVVGEHQTVIKPLGQLYKEVPGISGATILGDGSVALILEPAALVQLAEKMERESI